MRLKRYSVATDRLPLVLVTDEFFVCFVVFDDLTGHFCPQFRKIYWIDVHVGDTATSTLKPMSLAAHVDKQVVLFGVAAE